MKTPAFASNSSDDLHCVQACVDMTLQHFLPDQTFSGQELEERTGFTKGKATWEMAAILNYLQLGLEVKVITAVSYQRLADKWSEYLQETMGAKGAQWSMDYTGDEKLERQRAAKVAKIGIAEERIPTKKDIVEYISSGWLVTIILNSRKLNNKDGYFGHSVLIYDVNKSGVIMHDPGLPAIPGRQVDWSILEEAWSDPSKQAKLLVAVGKF